MLVGDSSTAAAPGDGAFADWLTTDVTAKLAFMTKHRPLPLAVGTSVLENHPPLFDSTGRTNRTAYRWREDDLWALGMNRILRLNWHGGRVELDYSDYHHLGRITSGMSGWVMGGEVRAQALENELTEVL